MRYSRKRSGRKFGAMKKRGKRFGAKWSIGGSYSHPLFGKIGGSFRSNSLASKVKAIVRHDIETPQHAGLSDTDTGILVTKNIIGALSFLDLIPQGTTNGSRVGDTIHLDAIKFNYTFTGVSGSSLYDKTFRIMLIKKDIQTNTGGGWSTAVFTVPDLSIRAQSGNYTGGVYANNLIVDPKKVTVLYDQEVVLKAPYDAGSNQVMSKTVAGTIRLDQKYVYQTSQTFGKDYNLYWLITGSIPVGAVAVNVGVCELNQDLIFKNCV